MQDFPSIEKIKLSHWDHTAFREHRLQVDVMRLDQMHPIVSGNKWFKLKYFLEQAKQEGKKKLVSFGGAYSNHLIALAEACRLHGFSSAAYVRGEDAKNLSHTLQEARERGMELRFLSRSDYREKQISVFGTGHEYPGKDDLLVPEGGAGIEGVRGAAEILSLIPTRSYAYICCAVGTGTTLAGLINGSYPDQKILGISVLKGTRHFEPLNPAWLASPGIPERVHMFHEDQFGGYAKTTPKLFECMNRIFMDSGIPTDFVYTGKLFYSIVRLASEEYFPARSRILVLHTGGMQGNRSLAPGLLQF